MTFIFPNIILPSLNEIIKLSKFQKRGYSPYAAHKRDIEIVLVARIHETLSEWHCPDWLVEPGSNFDFVWTATDRRTDPDNRAAGQKFVFDAFVSSGVLPNDNAKYVNAISHRFRYADEPSLAVAITGQSNPAYPPLR